MEYDTPVQQYERAVALHRAGRLQEAAELYREIVRAQPGHYRALHLLGVIELERGRGQEAVLCIDEAVRIEPRFAAAWYNRGNALLRLGRLEEALASYDRALALRPDDAEAHHNRALALQGLRRHAQALDSLGRAVSLGGGGAEVYKLRGELLHDLGRLEEALASYDRALALRADYAEACNNRGLILQLMRRHDAALADFERALALKPDYAEAHNNRGAVLQSLRRPGEALASFDAALACHPEFAEAHNNRGLALQALQRPADAVASYREACRLRPDYAEAHYNMAYSLTLMRRFEEALAGYDRALALDPTHALAHNNRGNVLKDLYRLDEAQASFEHALALQPDLAEVFTSRLLGLLYQSNISPQTIYQEHLRFGERYEAPLKPLWPRHANDRDAERRLKVGYVSADLRRHSVAYFVEPIWAHHDKGEVEVYAYYNAARDDEVTARLRACTDHWRACVGWPDEELAERIRADGIDILVDLSGHTGKHRLLTFARKPAPVQVSYLGYAATTGLTAMDWRLTHADVDPAGYEAYYTERLYRLPGSLWCYRPSPELGEVAAEPPLSTRGHVTFGSMNNLAKVSPETIAVWAEILQALPDARLVMTHVPGGAGVELAQRFARHGIDAGRLRLHDKLPAADYRALLQQIDIALDPFPYAGTTTTCDTLWQGIPVVTLIGDSAVSRSGYALLKAVGLEELAAADTAGYVKLATALAGDPARLGSLRQGLRARVEGSVLRDEAGFTRALEAAYRQLWRAWCGG